MSVTPSDTVLLEAVLDVEQLNEECRTAFDDMLSRIKQGHIKALSRQQREWVERLYKQYECDSNETANLYSSGKVKAGSGPQPVYPWETKTGRSHPLKPPPKPPGKLAAAPVL